MRKLIILYAVILLVLLPVAGCQQQSSSLPDIESLTYTNSEYGFSVEYPKDWDVMEDYMGTAVAFMGPLVLEDTYYININVFTEQLLEDMTLEDYVKLSDLSAKRTIPNYNKQQEYSTTIGGLPATILVATQTFELDGEDIALKEKYAIFIKDEIGYTITYDVPAEFHDEYLDSFDLAINSFKFE